MTRRLVALAPLALVVLALGCNNCPTYSPAVAAGIVTHPDIDEASGLVGGRLDPNVLWVHNDSGDTARVFALDTSGAWLGTYTFEGAGAVDWEDIAIGPGPESGVSYLHAADIGDNAQARTSVSVYRAKEPAVSGVPGTFPVTGVERLRLQYPDGAHNAETLLVDPLNGDLYIVTKPPAAGTASQVFRAAAPVDVSSITIMTEVAALLFGQGDLPGGFQPTGGDMDALRQFIAIRTYNSAFAWCFEPGATVAETLAGPICPLPLAVEIQGESLGFNADASQYFTLSELTNQTLHRYDRTDTSS